MGGRSFRAFLPRRLRARVRQPEEMRTGRPQYGQLILDGEPVSGVLEIEAASLVWSSDGGRLAAQELVSWPDAPITRVVVFESSSGRDRCFSSKTGHCEPSQLRAAGADLPPLA